MRAVGASGIRLRGVACLPVLVALAWLAATGFPGPAAAGAQTAELFGPDLYSAQCAGCHGGGGVGITGRGPAVIGEGQAAVDFVLRTGRMPMADPDMDAHRGPVQYSEAQIVSLVEYVGGLGDGPPIPAVDVAAGNVQRGGELYRLNCAACHVASGSGAAIGGGREAPTLLLATSTQIGEAIRIGPGAMPAFATLSPGDVDDVAAYVTFLQRSDTTSVRSFGGAGPVAEGLAAWLLALLPLIGLTRWIGSRHAGRDAGAHPPEAAS